MALDVLILGPFVFTDFATPERLPFGGKHQMHVHKMPGGSRSIDMMGPDDNERYFTGILWGADALNEALTLDALRRAGVELPYSNGVESRTVVIATFEPVVKKFTCIEFAITLITSDDSSVGSLGITSLDSLIASDALSIVSLLP